MNDGNDWRQRAMLLGDKSTNGPVVDKDALAERVRDAEAAKTALLDEQIKLGRHLARGVVATVIVEFAEAVGDGSVQPIVEEHHQRMLSVTAEIQGKPVVVNILLLPTGKIRLTCFLGTSGEGYEREIDATNKDEAISEWLGGELVNFFESEERKSS